MWLSQTTDMVFSLWFQATTEERIKCGEVNVSSQPHEHKGVIWGEAKILKLPRAESYVDVERIVNNIQFRNLKARGVPTAPSGWLSAVGLWGKTEVPEQFYWFSYTEKKQTPVKTTCNVLFQLWIWTFPPFNKSHLHIC